MLVKPVCLHEKRNQDKRQQQGESKDKEDTTDNTTMEEDQAVEEEKEGLTEGQGHLLEGEATQQASTGNRHHLDPRHQKVGPLQYHQIKTQ